MLKRKIEQTLIDWKKKTGRKNCLLIKTSYEMSSEKWKKRFRFIALIFQRVRHKKRQRQKAVTLRKIPTGARVAPQRCPILRVGQKQ